MDVGAVLIEKKYIKERHLKSLRRKQEKLLEQDGEGTVEMNAPQPARLAPPVQVPSATDATFIAPDPGSSALLSDAGSLVLFGQIAISQGIVSEVDLERGSFGCEK